MSGKKGMKWKSQSSKDKLSKSMEGNRNQEKKKSQKTKDKISESMKGNSNTLGIQYGEETKQKDRIAKIGSKNPAWKNGSSFEPYSPDFNKELKNKIALRDSEVCQLCGIITVNKLSHIHHIDYNKKNTQEDNLISLCHSCHSKTNHRREYFIKLFEWIVKKRDFFNMLNKATIQHSDFMKFDRTKNLQDQLQDMLDYNVVDEQLCVIVDFFEDVRKVSGKYFMTFEQLWFAFVMKEKFSKVWNGEEWTVTTTQ